MTCRGPDNARNLTTIDTTPDEKLARKRDYIGTTYAASYSNYRIPMFAQGYQTAVKYEKYLDIQIITCICPHNVMKLVKIRLL